MEVLNVFSPWCRVDSHHKLSGKKKKQHISGQTEGKVLLVRKTSALPCLRSYSDKFKQICRTQCYKLLKHQWRSSLQVLRKENKSAGNKSTLYQVCDRYLCRRKPAARHSYSVGNFSFYDARVFHSSTSMLCAFEIYLSEPVFMQCIEFLFKSKSKSYAMGMHSITNTCHKQQIQGSLFVAFLNPIQNYPPAIPPPLHPPKHKQSSLTKKNTPSARSPPASFHIWIFSVIL